MDMCMHLVQRLVCVVTVCFRKSTAPTSFYLTEKEAAAPILQPSLSLSHTLTPTKSPLKETNQINFPGQVTPNDCHSSPGTPAVNIPNFKTPDKKCKNYASLCFKFLT